MTIFNLTIGNDTITGTSGTDTFQGPSGGFDILDGGAGDDIFYIGTGTASVSSGTIDGGTDLDRLFAAGTSPAARSPESKHCCLGSPRCG